MKVKRNKKCVMDRLAHNKRITWYLAPILARAKVIGERNKRVKALVDKAFPELRGENVAA